MKSNMLMTVLSGVILTGTLSTPVLAATHQPAKMTCEEFTALDETAQPKVVYWAEGFNHKGKPKDAVIDIDSTDKLVPVLITECKKTPKASFWQKVKSHF
jgi:hypothetical protein|uniref:Putative stress response protein acid-resistance protein n=1 Tax=mine drainage metagenome TaxID=410659 RepID=E6QRD0_9ZZZZ